MKMRLAVVIELSAILVLSNCVHAQTLSDAQRSWNTVLDRLARREGTTDSVHAVALLERSIQRTDEEKPTVITRATANIWKDGSKYRVEIENEISMESPEQGMQYTPTGIRRETIAFDGVTVCQARDLDNGARTGVDYGRDYALPLMFAGFPSPDPIRPWVSSLRVDRLQNKEFNCDFLHSGMLRAQSKETDPTSRDRQFFYVLPNSNEIRRYEIKDSSGKLLSSIDLTWGELHGTVFLQRFFRKGVSVSSQFPGELFKDIYTFEILDFQTDVSISDYWFSRDSMGEARNWIEKPTSN